MLSSAPAGESSKYAVHIYVALEKRFRSVFIPADATFQQLEMILIAELESEGGNGRHNGRSGIGKDSSVPSTAAAFQKVVILYFSALRQRRAMLMPLEERQRVASTMHRELSRLPPFGFILLALVDVRFGVETPAQRSRRNDAAAAASSALLGRRGSLTVKFGLSTHDGAADGVENYAPSPADDRRQQAQQRWVRHFTHSNVVCGCTEWKLRAYGNGDGGAVIEAPAGPGPADASSSAVSRVSVRQALRRTTQTLTHSLFNAVGNIAVMQGRLQRLVRNPAKQEIWR